MTRQQELAALDNFIQSLPEDTYIRPCLEAYRPIIARDMEVDFIPDLATFRNQAHDLKCEVTEARAQLAHLEKQIKMAERTQAAEFAAADQAVRRLYALQEQAEDFARSIIASVSAVKRQCETIQLCAGGLAPS